MPLTKPGLWIVATPIGNPEDLSPRAARILTEADLVLAEDTRRAAQMFRLCGLPKREFLSFFEHNEQERQQQVFDALQKGQSVALISDAGTPLVADPGYRLVRACRQAGFNVSPVPGPSAPLTALSAAGIPPLPFTFLGFLGRSENSRQDIFQKFKSSPGSIIFFERNDRVHETLKICQRVLGERQIAICRELTKTHEEFIIINLSDLSVLPAELPGEITVIIGPAQTADKASSREVMAALQEELPGHKSKKAACRTVSQRFPGWSSSEIYNLLINELNAEQHI